MPKSNSIKALSQGQSSRQNLNFAWVKMQPILKTGIADLRYLGSVPNQPPKGERA